MNTAVSVATRWSLARDQGSLVIPLTLAAIIGVWVVDQQVLYESPFLLTALNFLFSTLVLLLIVALVSRSFLARSEPGLLLFSCGALTWGLSSVAAAAVSFDNVNTTPIISNLGGWLSSVCHLAGVLLSLRSRPNLRPARSWLVLAYSLVVAVVAGITLAAIHGWVPAFFIQGLGGTPLRYVVLGSAITMFALTAVLLISTRPCRECAFTYYYAIALGLIATGFFGVMLQVSVFSPLFWTSLATQFIGGAYMLLAALAVVREPCLGTVSLLSSAASPASQAMARITSTNSGRLLVRYACALLAVGAATALHLLVHIMAGREFPPYLPYFCALMVVALLGGLGPGLFTTALAIFAVVTWVLPRTEQAPMLGLAPSDRLGLVLFALTGVFTSVIAHFYRHSRDKAAAYDREAAVRETNARLATFAAATFEGIVQSEHGIILDCNEQFAHMLGYTVPALIGKDIATLIAPEDHDRVMANIKLGKATRIEHGAIRKDGSRILVEARGRPITPASTRRHTAVRDITEQKETERALREAEERIRHYAQDLEQLVQERTSRLQEAVNDLEQSTYSISHDMRAPLRAMNQYAQFLVEEYGPKLEGQGEMFLKRISGAALRLDRLIVDVLSYHQMLRGNLALETVDLDALARDIVQQYPAIHEHHAGIELLGHLAPVRANLAALTQCVSNLIINAVKFVPPGIKPQVRLWTESRKDFIRLCVQDNGIGIEPSQLDRIWGIFQQVHVGTYYEGTGIGLSIVKKAVERMGGRVGVTSEPGKGSVFWLELPAPA